ncbi:hypothetical protein SI65_00152 [Aspergillus cristatus]|uniref:Uncharacterized protein n=1 Tax=Aspergillus cristatus TaxID=573508 RepID=A0A1E3BNL4_ASPCR|nr:hypothetical protein SI65_00152 [Aspergillus cristatus]
MTADPTDYSTTTFRTINNIDNSAQTAYTGDTTYGTYEDDAITDYGLRGATDQKPYSTPDTATASGTRGYDPSDYSNIAVQDGGGHTAYDPVTGAYDEHYDYRAENSTKHHRERMLPDGTYQLREVDRFDDGTARVHREYSNPNTGTNYIKDYQK